MVDSIAIVPSNNERSELVRIYSNYSHLNGNHEVVKQNMLREDVDNQIRTLSQAGNGSNSSSSYHRGILRGKTVDDRIHLRPLCTTGDVALAIRELLNPSIFKEGCIQFPSALRGPFRRKRDTLHLVRYALNKPTEFFILAPRVSNSTTGRPLSLEIQYFLCPSLCSDYYTMTQVEPSDALKEAATEVLALMASRWSGERLLVNAEMLFDGLVPESESEQKSHRTMRTGNIGSPKPIVSTDVPSDIRYRLVTVQCAKIVHRHAPLKRANLNCESFAPSSLMYLRLFNALYHIELSKQCGFAGISVQDLETLERPRTKSIEYAMSTESIDYNAVPEEELEVDVEVAQLLKANPFLQETYKRAFDAAINMARKIVGRFVAKSGDGYDRDENLVDEKDELDEEEERENDGAIETSAEEPLQGSQPDRSASPSVTTPDWLHFTSEEEQAALKAEYKLPLTGSPQSPTLPEGYIMLRQYHQALVLREEEEQQRERLEELKAKEREKVYGIKSKSAVKNKTAKTEAKLQSPIAATCWPAVYTERKGAREDDETVLRREIQLNMKKDILGFLTRSAAARPSQDTAAGHLVDEYPPYQATPISPPKAASQKSSEARKILRIASYFESIEAQASVEMTSPVRKQRYGFDDTKLLEAAYRTACRMDMGMLLAGNEEEKNPEKLILAAVAKEVSQQDAHDSVQINSDASLEAPQDANIIPIRSRAAASTKEALAAESDAMLELFLSFMDPALAQRIRKGIERKQRRLAERRAERERLRALFQYQQLRGHAMPTDSHTPVIEGPSDNLDVDNEEDLENAIDEALLAAAAERRRLAKSFLTTSKFGYLREKKKMTVRVQPVEPATLAAPARALNLDRLNEAIKTFLLRMLIGEREGNSGRREGEGRYLTPRHVDGSIIAGEQQEHEKRVDTARSDVSSSVLERSESVEQQVKERYTGYGRAGGGRFWGDVMEAATIGGVTIEEPPDEEVRELVEKVGLQLDPETSQTSTDVNDGLDDKQDDGLPVSPTSGQLHQAMLERKRLRTLLLDDDLSDDEDEQVQLVAECVVDDLIDAAVMCSEQQAVEVLAWVAELAGEEIFVSAAAIAREAMLELTPLVNTKKGRGNRRSNQKCGFRSRSTIKQQSPPKDERRSSGMFGGHVSNKDVIEVITVAKYDFGSNTSSRNARAAPKQFFPSHSSTTTPNASMPPDSTQPSRQASTQQRVHSQTTSALKNSSSGAARHISIDVPQIGHVLKGDSQPSGKVAAGFGDSGAATAADNKSASRSRMANIRARAQASGLKENRAFDDEQRCSGIGGDLIAKQDSEGRSAVSDIEKGTDKLVPIVPYTPPPSAPAPAPARRILSAGMQISAEPLGADSQPKVTLPPSTPQPVIHAAPILTAHENATQFIAPLVANTCTNISQRIGQALDRVATLARNHAESVCSHVCSTLGRFPPRPTSLGILLASRSSKMSVTEGNTSSSRDIRRTGGATSFLSLSVHYGGQSMTLGEEPIQASIPESTTGAKCVENDSLAGETHGAAIAANTVSMTPRTQVGIAVVVRGSDKTRKKDRETVADRRHDEPLGPVEKELERYLPPEALHDARKIAHHERHDPQSALRVSRPLTGSPAKRKDGLYRGLSQSKPMHQFRHVVPSAATTLTPAIGSGRVRTASRDSMGKRPQSMISAPEYNIIARERQQMKMKALKQARVAAVQKLVPTLPCFDMLQIVLSYKDNQAITDSVTGPQDDALDPASSEPQCDEDESALMCDTRGECPSAVVIAEHREMVQRFVDMSVQQALEATSMIIQARHVISKFAGFADPLPDLPEMDISLTPCSPVISPSSKKDYLSHLHKTRATGRTRGRRGLAIPAAPTGPHRPDSRLSVSNTQPQTRDTDAICRRGDEEDNTDSSTGVQGSLLALKLKASSPPSPKTLFLTRKRMNRAPGHTADIASTESDTLSDVTTLNIAAPVLQPHPPNPVAEWRAHRTMRGLSQQSDSRPKEPSSDQGESPSRDKSTAGTPTNPEKALVMTAHKPATPETTTPQSPSPKAQLHLLKSRVTLGRKASPKKSAEVRPINHILGDILSNEIALSVASQSLFRSSNHEEALLASRGIEMHEEVVVAEKGIDGVLELRQRLTMDSHEGSGHIASTSSYDC